MNMILVPLIWFPWYATNILLALLHPRWSKYVHAWILVNYREWSIRRWLPKRFRLKLSHKKWFSRLKKQQNKEVYINDSPEGSLLTALTSCRETPWPKNSWTRSRTDALKSLKSRTFFFISTTVPLIFFTVFLVPLLWSPVMASIMLCNIFLSFSCLLRLLA